jgi:GAF domain-containing protein
MFERWRTPLGEDLYLHYVAAADGAVLELQLSEGIAPEALERISRVPFGTTVCGKVAETRKLVVASHLQESRDDDAALARKWGMQMWVCAPLLIGERLLGTLAFGSRTRSSPTAEKVEMLRAATQLVAVAMARDAVMFGTAHRDKKAAGELYCMDAHHLAFSSHGQFRRRGGRSQG